MSIYILGPSTRNVESRHTARSLTHDGKGINLPAGSTRGCFYYFTAPTSPWSTDLEAWKAYANIDFLCVNICIWLVKSPPITSIWQFFGLAVVYPDIKYYIVREDRVLCICFMPYITGIYWIWEQQIMVAEEGKGDDLRSIAQMITVTFVSKL